MFETLLPTKLYMPPNRPDQVARPRLLAKLVLQPQTRLVLVSAAAGYGKTTLVTSWLSDLRFTIDDASASLSTSLRESVAMRDEIVNPKSKIYNQICWVSLDGEESNPAQFFAYLAAAIRPLSNARTSLAQQLQANQPLPAAALAKTLVQDVAPVSEPFILVLDDYHLIESPDVDGAVAFLLQHMPPQMKLVIATREDPNLPLARLRVRNQLVELRAHDLRFTADEAAAFLNEVMGLRLTEADIAALEARTEGWIAGLQLAALALQSQQDAGRFIESFGGSHRFVLDYLMEEVLQQQPESVQVFLLRTAVLDRLSSSLCDAVVGDAISAQETLDYLEQANLFLIPLDDERRWYRYHHLLRDLLRQRLQQQGDDLVNGLHLRASEWYVANDLDIEAFHHATTAGDIGRAAQIVDAKVTPLQFRGGAGPVFNWLRGLETAVLDANPALWVMYASTMLAVGQLTAIEEKVQAAERALQGVALDAQTRDLIGRIASIRAAVGVAEHDAEMIIAQCRRALEYLHPNNLSVRTSINWSLGYAYRLQGDRAAAARSLAEAQASAISIGHGIMMVMTTMGVANIQELQLELRQAAQIYQNMLQVVGEPLPPAMCEVYLGLARIHYAWNDLAAAERFWVKNVPLAEQFGTRIDRVVMSDLFLARLRLAQGAVAEATAVLARAAQMAEQHGFVMQLAETAALRVLILLREGDGQAVHQQTDAWQTPRLQTAVQLAENHNQPLSHARIHLAQGETAAALAVLEPLRQQMEVKGWQDKLLETMVLQALVNEAHGDTAEAGQLVLAALALAAPENIMRLFIDEGQSMAALLTRIRGDASLLVGESLRDFVDKLLAALGRTSAAQLLVDPLSERELEVLRLIAQGLSNREIGERLVLAMDTVKGHNRRIFGKLGVRRRTEAVARGRELGLL
ncbi:MAG: LuxR C-terminal-related transcriptional regulator [Chloroflexota bacterium]